MMCDGDVVMGVWSAGADGDEMIEAPRLARDLAFADVTSPTVSLGDLVDVDPFGCSLDVLASHPF